MTRAMLILAYLAGTPLWTLTGTGVDAYLQALHRQNTSFHDRLAKVLDDAVGTPYANGPLGEGPAGTHDKDPLMDLSRVDCVTLVEQAIALASSHSYDETFRRLQAIRYKGGVVTFEARNHFMETDWVENNTFCRNVTGALGLPTQADTRTISRREFFVRVNAPELGQTTEDRELVLEYIPCSQAKAATAVMPSPSLVCFVGKVNWLFVLHCGVFIRDQEGNGRLYQASSKAGRVMVGSLEDFLKATDRYLGFTVHKICEPAED